MAPFIPLFISPPVLVFCPVGAVAPGLAGVLRQMLKMCVMQAMEHYAKFDVHAAQRHVAPAVLGFFRSVALGQASGGFSMTANPHW